MSEDELQNENACWRCNGEGLMECETCSGRGGRNAQRYTNTDFSYENFGFRMGWETCSNCDGSGKETCTVCNGMGEI